MNEQTNKTYFMYLYSFFLQKIYILDLFVINRLELYILQYILKYCPVTFMYVGMYVTCILILF